MRFPKLLLGALVLAGTGAAPAQLVPRLPDPGGLIDRVGPLAQDVTSTTVRGAERLAQTRIDRLTALIRANPDRIERDPDGFPARAGEVVVSDPTDALVAAAVARGYRVIERSDLLGVDFARLGTPVGRSLGQAIREVRKLGARDVSADQLHLRSGRAAAVAPVEAPGAGPVVGIVDGGALGPTAATRGFAAGAPQPSDHGTAVASLITGHLGVRGAVPGARLLVADVYGTDPAGGNAVAIAKALAWLVGERVPVVNLSLVGPSNPLLARVVAAAQARGTILVAAVGNDGPAAPPSYPASYPGVIAVTGVDARGRVLIEAGRASNLDYAAPADLLAADAAGRTHRVRGTSYAAPLVAGVIARAYRQPDPAARRAALARVDAQARRLGPRYGRGLVCGDCGTVSAK